MKNNLTRMVFLAFVLCAARSASAQHFLRTWVQTFNGPQYDNDEIVAMAIDRNDHVFVTGKTAHSGTVPLSYDYATIAYSSAGAPLWTNIFDGPAGGSDTAHAIAVDTNGNVFVTGSSVVISADYATIAYSNSGIPLWTNFYDGPAHDTDIAFAEAVDANGNVFVTGRSRDIGYDYATIGYSGAGVPLWTNRYNGPGNGDDTATAIALDRQGNVFVTGHSAGTNGIAHYATIAYSNAGLPLWTNRYEGGYGNAAAIAVDTNGNVIVTGSGTPTLATGQSDYVTLKYSPAGIPLWTNLYNGPGGTNDTATALAVNRAGDVFVTGYSPATKIMPDSFDYATIKYSSDGVPQWTNRYDGPGHSDDEPAAIALDTNENVIVTGYFWGSFYDGGNDPHCATIAYSSAGVALWTNEYVSLYNYPETASAIAVDSQNHVYIGGTTSGFFDDYLTFQLAAAQPIPLGVQPATNGLVLSWTNAGFALQAAPSPTGAFTNIPFAVSPYTNSFTDPQSFFRLIAN